jgi:prepilin-type processing-associated H-X9-DG protein/prepilin-type N-terminal cleavage/methylation domain-containing protein
MVFLFRHRARGATLIELLTVIAIVGLLLSLTMPAIQSARESSRRTECANHFKQLGIAFLNFETANRAFPSEQTVQLSGPLLSQPEISSHNVVIDLLPFLEETTLSNLYDRRSMFCSARNRTCVSRELAVVRCPSAPRSEATAAIKWTTKPAEKLIVDNVEWAQTPGQLLTYAKLKQFFGLLDMKYPGTFQAAVTDYAVPINAQVDLAERMGYKITEHRYEGLHSLFPSVVLNASSLDQVNSIMYSKGTILLKAQKTAAQVKDGLMHTFMMTEVSGRPDHWENGQLVGTNRLPCAWADSFATSLCLLGSPSKDSPFLQRDNDGGIFSFHPDGVNFVFADGHVEFLSVDTEARLLLAFMTPDASDNK